MHELPASAIGLAGLVVIIAGQCWQTWASARRHRSVRDQLTNGHGTNLRDDIDKIAANQDRMRTDIDERVVPAITDVRRDIVRLSDRLRDETAERAAEDRAIAERIRRL